MKAAKTSFAMVAVFTGFCSAGWVWERNKAAGEASAATEATAKPAKASRRDGRSRSNIPPEVAARLAQVRAGRNTEERLRATIQLAQTLPVGDFQAWFDADWFDGTEDMQDYLFHRVVRARWLAEDPEGLMKYELRNRNQLYETSIAWAKRDPSKAVDFLMGMQNAEDRSRLIAYMGRDLAKADPELTLSRLPELKSKLAGSNWSQLTGIVDELAQSSPEALKAATADWPASFKEMIESSMIYAGLKKNLAAGIEGLAQSPKGKEQLLEAIERDPELANLALKHADKFPPGWLGELVSQNSYYLAQRDTMKWLDNDLTAMGLNEAQARGIRSEAIGHLGPEELSKLLSGSALSPEERERAFHSALGRLARDPKKAEEWIAKLTDEHEIQAAKQILKEASGPYESRDITPSGFITSFTEEESSMNWDRANTAARWGSEELRAASREFASLPEQQKQLVAGKLTSDDYEGVPLSLQAEAVSYLVNHPQTLPAAEEGGEPKPIVWMDKASRLASTWAEQDPNAASRWVTSLPAGETRLWAAKNLAMRWDLYEPEAARSWIGSLSGEEQNQVRAYLESGGEDD